MKEDSLHDIVRDFISCYSARDEKYHELVEDYPERLLNRLDDLRKVVEKIKKGDWVHIKRTYKDLEWGYTFEDVETLLKEAYKQHIEAFLEDLYSNNTPQDLIEKWEEKKNERI